MLSYLIYIYQKKNKKNTHLTLTLFQCIITSSQCIKYKRKKEVDVLDNITNYNAIVKYDDERDIVQEEDVQIIMPISKRHFKKGAFITMRKEFLFDLIMQYELKFLDIKLLSYFIKTIEFNNRIKPFTQKLLAEKVQSTQQNMSKSIKTLENKNIIYKNGLEWYFSDEFIKFAGDK